MEDSKFNKENSSKKRTIVTITYGLLVILILIGASYALFDYSFLGSRNAIEQNEIELEFLESSNEIIGVTNAIPISDDEGKIQAETFDFQVKTKTTGMTRINYNLVIEKLEATEGYTLLNDNEVKVYLTDYDNNVIVAPTLISDLDNYVLYSQTNSQDATNYEFRDKYKLRVWIDDSVIGEDWTTDTKIQYNFKIGVKTTEKASSNDVSDLLVTLSETNYTYDGSAKVPTITVKDRDKTLTKDTDYTVAYANNTNAGTGSVTITGIGNYTGTITKKFIINKAESVCSITSMPTLDYPKNTTGNIIYSCTGGGEVKVTSSNTQAITLGSFTSTSIPLTVSQKGSSTITIKQEGTANYKKSNEVVQNISIGISSYTVNVVVQNGTVDTASKQVVHGENVTFNLTPTSSGAIAAVTCTNDQIGTLENNVLTVSNVTKETTCTVKYVIENTTLYTDGTLIINENLANRSANIEAHGAVTKEYEAMDEANSYVFSSNTSMPWNSEKTSVASVEIGDEIQPVSTKYWAYGLTEMATGDFTKLDTSQVTNMSSMFYEAGKNASTFTLIGLDNWNTSKVTSMSMMFHMAGSNSTIWSVGDLSGWDTSSVTDMYSMFEDTAYNAATFILTGLNNWNTSQVTDMNSMFKITGSNATTWSIGDLSNWDTSQVTDMDWMFYMAGSNSSNWNIGDLSDWDTSQVTDMGRMFSYTGTKSLTWSVGDLSNWDVSKVTEMSEMFDSAGYSATTWTIGDLSRWNISNVIGINFMFNEAGYNALTFDIGDLSGWDTSSVTGMCYTFNNAGYNATTFNIGDLSGWNTSSVKDMSSMFSQAGYHANWSLDCSGWNVNKVTSYYDNFNYGVESKVTPPTWVN